MLTALVILCGLLLLLGFLLMPGESDMALRAPFWGRSFAHRGLHSPDKLVPENSLAAFTAAVEAGYGIELDIQLSADGQVVVFHDEDLKRVCGDPRRVAELPWKELAALRLFKTGQGIPRLRQVLRLVGGRVPLIVELKSGNNNARLCQAAWEVLRSYDGDFCVESFDPRIVGWWRRHVPGILRGQLADSGKNLGGSPGCYLLAGLFGNFYARPQFVAFGPGAKPPTARLVEKLCMRVAWTLRPGGDTAARQAEADAVIFEFYEPPPRYKTPPGQMPLPEIDENGDVSEDGGEEPAAPSAAEPPVGPEPVSEPLHSVPSSPEELAPKAPSPSAAKAGAAQRAASAEAPGEPAAPPGSGAPPA